MQFEQATEKEEKKVANGEGITESGRKRKVDEISGSEPKTAPWSFSIFSAVWSVLIWQMWTILMQCYHNLFLRNRIRGLVVINFIAITYRIWLIIYTNFDLARYSIITSDETSLSVGDSINNYLSTRRLLK